MPEALPSLGYEAIDTLHDEAEKRLNLAQQADDNALQALFDALYAHCQHHFATEEALMIARHYRGLSEHRQEHQHLLGEMAGMKRSLQRGRRALVRSWLRERLPEWLAQHVRQLDAQMVRSIGVSDK